MCRRTSFSAFSSALGGVEAWILPNLGEGFWPLVSMGAILGGTMRSPFTGVVFALELTHDINMMLPLLIAVICAHGFTVLVLRRSILTEKIARRGYHLSREYAIDPLEILSVREVMRTNVVALPAERRLDEVAGSLHVDSSKSPQRLYPVVDAEGCLLGVMTRFALRWQVGQLSENPTMRLADLTVTRAAVAYPQEPLRLIVHRMATTGLTRFPLVERETRKVLGLVSLEDLLKARARNLEAEQRRERIMRVRVAFPFAFSERPLS
jgi:CBS domain-containing protein